MKYNFLKDLQKNRNTRQYKMPKACHVFSNTFTLNFSISTLFTYRDTVA